MTLQVLPFNQCFSFRFASGILLARNFLDESRNVNSFLLGCLGLLHGHQRCGPITLLGRVCCRVNRTACAVINATRCPACLRCTCTTTCAADISRLQSDIIWKKVQTRSLLKTEIESAERIWQNHLNSWSVNDFHFNIEKFVGPILEHVSRFFFCKKICERLMVGK